MILVTFAVPQESRDFLARLHHGGTLGPAEVGNLGLEEVAVVHTGMGAAAARRAAEAALAELHPRTVIGAGFAGGLDPSLAVGQLIFAENLGAPAASLPAHRSGEGAASTGSIRPVRLVSVEHALDTPDAKARLRADTGADAVDLESAALAEVCAAHHIPLLILRIVSDAATDPLPLPSEIAYDVEHQRIRPLAIFTHLGEQPRAIDPLARFAHHLPMLQRELANALVAVISPAA